MAKNVGLNIERWGTESTSTLLAGGQHFMVKEETIAPSDFEPWHFHKLTHQVFYCLEGEVEVHLPGEKHTLAKGEACLVKAFQPHTAYNNTGTNSRFLLISIGEGKDDHYGLNFPYPTRHPHCTAVTKVIAVNRFKRTAELALLAREDVKALEQDIERLFLEQHLRLLNFKVKTDTGQWLREKLPVVASGTAGFHLAAKDWILNHPGLSVQSFEPASAEDFTRLNAAWIKKYFVMEPNDWMALNSPYESIVKPGGEIFFCLFRKKAVATGALYWNEMQELELTKMATEPNFQGLGLGALIIDQVLAWAQKKEIAEIVLYTQSSLFPALKLYENKGFKYVALQAGYYDRADVKMILKL